MNRTNLSQQSISLLSVESLSLSLIQLQGSLSAVKNSMSFGFSMNIDH